MAFDVTPEQVREWTHGQLWDYAVGALVFDFKMMKSGGIETQYPYMPEKEKLPAIRVIDREMQRRGVGFIGFIELRLMEDEPMFAEPL